MGRKRNGRQATGKKSDDDSFQFDTNPAVASIYYDVLRLRRKMQSIAQQCGSDVGLRWPELGVLNVLRRLGPMTMGDLTRHSVITQANSTRIVRSLVDKKYVHRVRSATSDDREVMVELTRAGEKALGQAYPRMVQEIDDLLSTALTDVERDRLVRLLKKVTDNLDMPL